MKTRPVTKRHTIEVPDVGTVIVRESRTELFEASQSRWRFYHRVTFRALDGTSTTLTVGAPARPGEQFSLYDTIHSAMAFWRHDMEVEGEGRDEECVPWECSMEIPYGSVTVTRDAYRVFSTPDGDSDRTRGRQRRATVRIRRYLDEPIIDAMGRALEHVEVWSDIAMFDSVTSFDPPWRTVDSRDMSVSEASERTYGEAYVEHTLSLDGEILAHAGELARQLKEAGASW